MKNDNKGFTLVETLAVLVILAILAAVAIPAMTGFIDDAKKKSYITEASTVCIAVQTYIMEQYAKGDVDSFTIYDELTMHKLGEEENPISDILEGSYTPGARIEGISMIDKPLKFMGITYRVKSYKITINLGEDVKVERVTE